MTRYGILHSGTGRGLFVRTALIPACLLYAVCLSAQSRVDSALVQMARAQVAFYDIPQLEHLERPGIVRSRYNTVYPVSWQVADATLTDTQASVSLFVIRLANRQQKTQSLDTFYDRTLHRAICQQYQGRYLQSVYFRTAKGKNALRIDMLCDAEPGGPQYRCVYFVWLSDRDIISGLGCAATERPLVQDSTSVGQTGGKYRVLFDALVKNIDRR